MSAAKYTGHIYLDGPDKGEGEIVDAWGWVISIRGTRGVRDGRAVLVLDGTLGPTPERLRIEGVDDAVTGARL